MFLLGRCVGAIALVGGALWLAGCGGGSSGPSPTPTNTPSPTASGTPISRNVIVVRLRDTTGAPVDGVVALVVGADTFRLGTTNGDASFAGFVAGAYSVSAQVNGQTQSRNFSAASGTTTVDLVFSPNTTPTPQNTIPPPPF